MHVADVHLVCPCAPGLRVAGYGLQPARYVLLACELLGHNNRHIINKSFGIGKRVCLCDEHGGQSASRTPRSSPNDLRYSLHSELLAISIGLGKGLLGQDVASMHP